jgi:hypothetical protein
MEYAPSSRRKLFTMARAFVFSFVLAYCQLAAAAAETALTGAEITTVLSERSLYADGVEQIFRKSGQTFYLQNGSSSSGSWKVEGDQYCSVWPPNPAWACYGVLQDGDSIIFVSRSGQRYPMRLSK